MLFIEELVQNRARSCAVVLPATSASGAAWLAWSTGDNSTGFVFHRSSDPAAPSLAESGTTHEKDEQESCTKKSDRDEDELLKHALPILHP